MIRNHPGNYVLKSNNYVEEQIQKEHLPEAETDRTMIGDLASTQQKEHLPEAETLI